MDKRRKQHKEMEEAFSDDIVKPLTPARQAALAEFLDRPDRPEESLTVGEVEVSVHRSGLPRPGTAVRVAADGLRW